MTKVFKNKTVGFSFGKVAVYEYSDNGVSTTTTINKKTVAKPWYPWGDDNNLPQLIFSTVYKNDIKPSLINKCINLALGDGLQYYLKTKKADGSGFEKKYVDIPAVERFFEEIDLDQFCLERMSNIMHFWNCFTEILEADGKLISAKNISCLDVRSEYFNEETGKIEAYYMCGNWERPKFMDNDLTKGNVLRVDAFHNESEKVIHHSKVYLPGQDYYSFPIWWFGTQKWAELSNEIPKFQLANIKNSANIKFHVSIPASYFDGFSDDEIETQKTELQEKLDEMLISSGDKENQVSTFYSYVNQINGNPEEWKITPISANMQDKAFMDTFNVATRANSRGHGLHPILAGVDVGGNLGSGAEIRNLYNYYIVSELPMIRKTFLKLFYDLKKKYKWHEKLEFEINYQQMVTGDTSHNGLQSAAK